MGKAGLLKASLLFPMIAFYALVMGSFFQRDNRPAPAATSDLPSTTQNGRCRQTRGTFFVSARPCTPARLAIRHIISLRWLRLATISQKIAGDASHAMPCCCCHAIMNQTMIKENPHHYLLLPPDQTSSWRENVCSMRARCGGSIDIGHR